MTTEDGSIYSNTALRRMQQGDCGESHGQNGLHSKILSQKSKRVGGRDVVSHHILTFEFSH